MDVHEKCVRFPPSHFADSVGVNAIEMHGHCSASPKRVAAHIGVSVAKLVEANRTSSVLESGVDVLRCDCLKANMEGGGIAKYVGGEGALVAENVVDPACKGFDRAVGGACAFLMDTLAFDTIFLVGHSNGGLCSIEECSQGGSVGDESAVGPSESDVLDPEGDCVGFGGSRSGVFTNPEQVVERNVDEIGGGGLFGAVWGVGPVVV